MGYREMGPEPDMIRPDKEATLFQNVETLLNHPYENERPCRWFISFGTLLYFIRDKKLGRPFKQDIDISLFGDAPIKSIVSYFSQYSMKPVTHMINDVTKEPLHVVFKAHHSIDIFVWVKANGYYWHTYDPDMTKDKIPKKYVWKGTPCELMDGEVWKYHWDERVGALNFPHLYGSLLDYWYPGWLVPDARFGQSKCEKIVTLKTCKNLKEKLR